MIPPRESTKKKVYDMLDKSYFSSTSFLVKFDEANSPFLKIVFLPNRSFEFSIAGYGPTYITTEAPGLHILSGEDFERAGFDPALKAIAPWTARILEDYRTQNPLLDGFEQLRKSLDEKLSEHIDDEALHFTADEAQAIRAKLDELTGKLSEVSEKNETLEKGLREAKQEIQAMKADLDIFPRGVWLRMAGGKVLNIIKKVVTSKEGRELAVEAAKKLFLEGPKT